MTKAELLLANSTGAADVGFRARLVAARANARSGRLPTDAELQKLWDELNVLPEKLADYKPKPREIAELCVLRALATKASATADPETVLQRLVEHPNVRSSLERGQWEHGQLEALAAWLQQAVKPEARSTKYTSMMRQVVARVSAAELRNLAETQWQARDFAALNQTLEEARHANISGPAVEQLREFGLLATLANSASTSP